MTIIEKLKEQKDFTDAEQALANYILNNIGDISKLTIYQLSENSFCSVATISRFCKKLKINNFSLFKVELAKEVSEKEDNEQAVEYNHPFDKDDSEEDIARKVRHLTRHAVMDAYNNLDYTIIHEAAVMLDEAEIIDVYGNWISMTHAINLHSKLLWMGKNSSLEPLRGFQHVKAKISNEKHLAVIISYYGTTRGNSILAKWLYQNNVPYILITGPKMNPLCLNATKIIHIPVEEDYTDKISSYATEAAIGYTINVLYSFLFALHYDENLQARYSAVDKNGHRDID